MILSVAENVVHEQVVSFAENLFSSLKSKTNSNFKKAKYTGSHSVIVKDLEQTTVVLWFESTSYLNIH